MDSSADIAWMIRYVCAAGVRHPEFGDAVNRWRTAAGETPLVGDDVQIARLVYLDNGLVPITQWRWRISHSRPGETRFIVSDLGWVYVGEQGKCALARWRPLAQATWALAQRAIVLEHS